MQDRKTQHEAQDAQCGVKFERTNAGALERGFLPSNASPAMEHWRPQRKCLDLFRRPRMQQRQRWRFSAVPVPSTSLLCKSEVDLWRFDTVPASTSRAL